ncbi:MAG: PQQ-like beta-propeller repeat protein [Saprospiraceae bacterium]|nr:PQQ-like beta-propeller repeat protein [Saprospiraceae bacterium]
MKEDKPVTKLNKAGNLLLKSICVLFLLLTEYITCAQVWPQFQQNAERHGRVENGIEPPFRVRWIWTGKDHVLRNQNSIADWSDDLDSRPGYDLPIRDSVDHTLAGTIQPVIGNNGKVYFATMEGWAYCLDADSGVTLWSYDLEAPCLSTAAIGDSIVVFTTVYGSVKAIHIDKGQLLWQRPTGFAITSHVLIHQGYVVVANQFGTVFCLNQAGNEIWSRQLSAGITGNLAAFENLIYVGSDDMIFYALSLNDGEVIASTRLTGQHFRFTHPVVHGSKVWVTSASFPILGSEYVMESLMDEASDFEQEEDFIRRWLMGDDNGGSWSDASKDWDHVFALDKNDLSRDFIIPAGPVDGVGFPAPSVVVDNKERVLTWWKTRFPTLTAASAFGTKYSLDIAAIDTVTGGRKRIDPGKLSGMWPLETDNLYAMSVAGDQVWLRQAFRGTQMIDMDQGSARLVVAPIRYNDGGNFSGADVNYIDQRPALPQGTYGPYLMPNRPTEGRTPPAFAHGKIYIAEHFGIVCLETAK